MQERGEEKSGQQMRADTWGCKEERGRFGGACEHSHMCTTCHTSGSRSLESKTPGNSLAAIRSCGHRRTNGWDPGFAEGERLEVKLGLVMGRSSERESGRFGTPNHARQITH